MKAGIRRAELARRGGISRARLVKFEETGAKRSPARRRRAGN